MGAKISGAGTSTITIDGVESLSGARVRVIPDRIETGTYAMAVAMTGGDVVLEGARPELLQTALDIIAQTGAEITPTNSGHPRAPQRRGIATGRRDDGAVPGLPTDLQAQFMGLMTMAKGKSRITETIFENRFMHVQELARLGAHITLSGQTAIVDGVAKLKGALSWRPICAPQCRWSSPASRPKARRRSTASTTSTAVFERLEEKLSNCGAVIERISA